MGEGPSPLLPWAVVGLVWAALLAVDPPIVAWNPFGHVWDGERRWARDFEEIEHTEADLLFLGNSRLGSVLAGTELDDWVADCGGPRRVVGVFPPFFSFDGATRRLPQLRALGPRSVVLQLELFLPSETRSNTEAERSALAQSAWTLGVDFTRSMTATGAAITAVDLPRSATLLAKEHPATRAEREAVIAALAALGVGVIRSGEVWEDSAFTDGVHFNEVGGARARAWLCDALRTLP